MSEILIKSRITPPGFGSGIIHRSRLIDLLNRNIEKSLLLICTSAGFGKTTLANDFAASNNLKYAWFYTSADINSFYTFFTYIIYSLKAINDKFGKNSLMLIQSLQKDTVLSKNSLGNINDCIAIFTNEFMECFNEDIFLVLDDLHNIDTGKNREWLKYFFDSLFENLPPKLHIIITTRDIPGFNINKLMAKRRLFQLSSKDLIFDNKETLELLRNVYSIQSTEEEVNILQSSIKGWITGIHLILQAYGKEFKKLKQSNQLSYAEIFNFFAKDIFENLNEKTKDFLLNTAILENFTSETCDHLLDIDFSSEIINELVNKNIFIELSAAQKDFELNDRKVYNYQELFKLFLLSKLRELKTQKEINSQFERLFKYYLNINETILAVNYGLNSEAYDLVIPLIIDNYRSMFEKGHYDILWKWLDLLPADLTKKNSHLLYLSGLLNLYFRSDPETSLKFINEVLNSEDNKSDVSLLVNCHILKTDTLLLLGKIENIKEDLNKLLLLEINKEERVRVLYEISRVLYREGHDRYDEIVKILSEALDICNEENLHAFKTNLFIMLGNVFSDWGDTVKSTHYYEQALNQNSDVYKTFRAMNLILAQYCTLGNFVKAKEYLDKSVALCNSFPSLLFKRFLLRSMGTLSFEIGDFEESIKRFTELNNLEIKSNIKHYQGIQYVWIGEAYYYLKKYDAALKNFDISLDYIDKNNEYHLLINSYTRSKTNLKIKFTSDAEKIFLETLEFHEKNKILQPKIQIEFHLANYYLKSGNPETALKYLRNCLNTSAEKQFVSFFNWEVFNSRTLFDFALSNNVQKQFVKSIFENVKGIVNFDWLSEKYRKRLTTELEFLKDLRLFSFGKTEIWLRGYPIEEEKWVRKKSKIILAYLLTKPGIILTKDKIIDLFFQDVPLENVDKIFHNTISNIRTAIKIENYAKKNKSAKSRNNSDKSMQLSPNLLNYEGKNLTLNNDYWFESDCFEFEKLYDLANSTSIDLGQKIEESAKAIDLYKGEFMPGFYDPWCEEMRQNYSNMFQRLCENLVNLYYSFGEHTNVIKYAEKLLETDKLHNEAYMKIIESYVKLNNINAAKNKFSSMLKNYDEELGEKPEKHVLDKIGNILDIS